jgi:hypothetical protein
MFFDSLMIVDITPEVTAIVARRMYKRGKDRFASSIKWKPDTKGTALSRSALSSDAATKLLYKGLRDRES